MKPPKFETICDFGNLLGAAKKALKSRWRYRKEAALFRLNCERELLRLKQELLAQTYQPLPYRTFIVHDPKERMISAAPIRDRAVHHALIQVIGPWLERSFIEHSYACRQGKGTHLAIQKAQQLARRYEFYIHLDVVKFFDTIDHAILKEILCKKISDPGIMWLLEKIVSWAAPNMPPGKSVPIGNLTSQYFGNLYLDALDHFIKDKLGIPGYLRYMDDLVIFHHQKMALQEVTKQVAAFANRKLQLSFAPDFVCPVASGIPFLGLRIFPNTLRLQQTRWRRFKAKFLEKQRQFLAQQISEDHFLLAVASMVSNLEYADTCHLRGEFFAKYAIEF